MRLQAPILGALAAWLVDQACATSQASALENTFNSPANVSARARVQRPTLCPSQCDSYDPVQWFVYPSAERVALCNETMLLDFAVYSALNDSDKRHTIRSCVLGQTGTLKNAAGATSCNTASSQSNSSYQVGLWSAAGSAVTNSSGAGVSMLQDVSTYMTGHCQKSSTFAFSDSAHVAVGVYVGGSVHLPQNIDAAVKAVTNVLQGTGSYQSMALQHCGKTASDTLGIAVDLNGDLAAVQQHVRSWNDGECVSGFTTSTNVSTTLASTNFSGLSAPAGSNSTMSRRSSHERRSDPPQPQANGTCYTYDVQAGDSCWAIATEYSITVDDIDSFNSDTWGWYGCNDLQAGSSICLSNGTAPLPLPIANAVCGPQVPGTDFTGTTNAGEWAALNPCPINVCCDVWGQCGNTPDYCNYTQAATGAPGTAPPGSNGCIWNCGTDIVNDATEPGDYFTVGYFESNSADRPCLDMNAFTIDPAKYTHVLFGFGNLTSDFEVDVSGQQQQFDFFTSLVGMKRIISFGGWDFSTGPDTYMIFREGVSEANRDTFVKNVADFVNNNNLDGVDFDWEYPGEPDIKGIPPGSDDEGANYLEFLKAMRAALPDKSLSITAPASYWYLKAFPIAEMADVVDFITYMTYDLHGVWDFDSKWSQDGCPAGNCLQSHVNLTETMWALSMISKAPVATSKIVVGVASYGRSFHMATPGCWTSTCTWDVAGQPGPCTQTAGYISNAEINEIVSNGGLSLYSGADSSNILIYNSTQWVSYMDDKNKENRTLLYQSYNFKGTGEWAIDLEEYEPYQYIGGNTTSSGLSDESLETDLGGQKLDVNPNLQCWSVAPDMNSTDQLNDVVVLGATYIDQVLKEFAGEQSTDWVLRMTNGHLQDSCAHFPTQGTGFCSVLSEDDCHDGKISSGLYYATFLASQLYANWVQWYNAFNEASFLSSFDIKTIATTFTPKRTGNTLTFESFLNGFNTALSIGSSVLPDPGGLFSAINTGESTIQSILDFFPTPDTFSLPTEEDLETGMTVALGALVNATIYGFSNVSTDIFEYPNYATGNISASLLAGPFENAVANYFYNVRPVTTIDSGSFAQLINTFTRTIQQYLVGAALADGDYYIVKGADIDKGDCDGVAKFYVDGACYMLAYPGSTSCSKDYFIQAEATNDTITSIQSYDISIPDMILNAEACINATNTYYGAVTVNVTEVATSGKLPTCFYNLPVFQLHERTLYGEKGWQKTYYPLDAFSPCFITQYLNGTLPITAGQSYLPDNLKKLYTLTNCACNLGHDS